MMPHSMNLVEPVYRPELLAPAGTFEALKAVYQAGADAVYLGMKALNMRMHRDDFNFDDRDYIRAQALARETGKRIYVVINSILREEEFDELQRLIEVYHRAEPDAFIIQELGVLDYFRQSGLRAEFHASTMMNCHSVEFALELRRLGIHRIITSRDVPLEALARMKAASGLSVEYFVHGDMCVSESSQCHHSGIVFGLSANRGQCLKSCRWEWDLVKRAPGEGSERVTSAGQYLLARSDMCLYRHLPELAAAGIDCLKIEGRMREPAYLAHLTRAYREAIDRFAEDPAGYRVDSDQWQNLMDHRVRNFTTSFAFKRGGNQSVSPDGKREPKFFSNYKIEPTVQHYDWARVRLDRPAAGAGHPMRLSVRTNGLGAATEALRSGANDLIVGGEQLARAGEGWNRKTLEQTARDATQHGATVRALSLKILTDRDLDTWRRRAREAESIGLVGLIVTNLGALRIAREVSSLPLHGDIALNIFNARTAAEFHRIGLSSAAVSVEADLDQCHRIIRRSPMPLAALGHGALAGMILSDCVISSCLHGLSPDDVCPAPCTSGRFALRDQAGLDHEILADSQCRNHLLVGTDICALPFLPLLSQAGFQELRLELHHLQPEQVGLVTRTYRKALDRIGTESNGEYRFPEEELTAIEKACGRPLGPGPYFKPKQLTQIEIRRKCGTFAPTPFRNRNGSGSRRQAKLVNA